MMAGTMMGYRVTKFDPMKREGQGGHVPDEWTSISDIGRAFHGAVLSPEEYQRMEDAYVHTALSFMIDSGVTELAIVGLENPGHYTEPGLELREGAMVRGSELERICRLNLREQIWCKLEGESGAFIHFGYDFYVGVTGPCGRTLSQARGLGLFVETMVSPYSA